MAETRTDRSGTTTTTARGPDAPGRSRSYRRHPHAAGSERAVVVICVAVIAVHVLDDNFVQLEPATTASGHLVSGLVPVLLLAATAAAYPRIRAGGRAVVAMTLGALGVVVGIPAAYFLRNGGIQGDHYTGLLAGIAGARPPRHGPRHPVAQPTYRRQPSTALPTPRAGGRLCAGARGGARSGSSSSRSPSGTSIPTPLPNRPSPTCVCRTRTSSSPLTTGSS